MNVVKVRKNFLLDKETVESAQKILQKKQQSLSQALNLYFKAIVKDETILDEVEKSAKKKSGNFIGMLDGKIGQEDWQKMKHDYYKNSDDRF